MTFALALSGGVSAAPVPIAKPGAATSKDAVAIVTWRGRQATRLVMTDLKEAALEVVRAPLMGDGTIDVDIAADITPKSDARGFAGIAFNIRTGSKFELFYLRTLNGRSNDQLQRNHTLQYTSEPDHPWQDLRTKTPGKYETYADLVPGVWTHLRIDVQGAKARFFVNGATQPSMVVDRLDPGPGGPTPVALWIGPGSVGWFANLKVTPARR